MGFEVKYLSSGKVRLDHLESVFNVEAMRNNKLIKKMDVMTLVIVMPTMEEAERLVIEYMRKNEKQRPYNIDVIVGFMDEASMDFTPYYEV
jgi:hypothetical protein